MAVNGNTLTLSLIERDNTIFFRRDTGPEIAVGTVEYSKEREETFLCLAPFAGGANSFAQDLAQEYAEGKGYGLMIPVGAHR